MSDDRTPAPGTTHTREQRLRALRALAQAGSSLDPREGPASADAPASRGAASARQSFNALLTRRTTARRRRRVVTLVTLVALVAVVAAGATYIVRSATPQRPATFVSHAQTSLAIYPQVDGNVACPAGAAISPDSQTMVVVGYQLQCPDDDFMDANEPGKVVIYSTYKRPNSQAIKSVTLSLDMLSQKIGIPLISQLPLQQSNGGIIILTLLYGAPVWSPHGRRIAIPFVVRPACYCALGPEGYQMTFEGSPTLVGLVELSAHGQFEAALSAPYNAAQRSVEWDTRQGTLVSGSGQLAPAQTYTWRGAHLTPTSPLSAKASSGPIGATQGAATFSIWQSGWGGSVFYSPVDYAATPTTNLDANIPMLQALGVFTLTPTFAAWSPDGRWLELPNFAPLVVTLNGKPAPATTALQVAGLAQAPQVPTRDAALSSLFASIPTVDDVAPMDAVAWSPNGALLAAASVSTSTPQDGDQVTLRDTRTGKIVAKLIPAVNLPDAFEINPLTLGESSFPLTQVHPQLQWSPDGSRLFLLNPTIGSITIWTLPAALAAGARH